MKKQLLLLLVLLSILVMPTVLANPIEVPFSTIEQYKETVGQSILIDVRSTYSRGDSKKGIQGAIWIDPHSGDALENFEQKEDKAKSYIVFCSCKDDGYSIRAAQILLKNGFQHVSVLKGGWDAILKDGVKTITLDQEAK